LLYRLSSLTFLLLADIANEAGSSLRSPVRIPNKSTGPARRVGFDITGRQKRPSLYYLPPPINFDGHSCNVGIKTYSWCNPFSFSLERAETVTGNQTRA